MAIPTPTPELSPDELSELLSAYMPDIPGYRVLRRLGQGGMSYVYLGVQESLDRQVAIKVIVPTALKDEIGKLRFEREARTIAKLQHPAIVSIHDVGRTELGLLYYVMPYLPRGHLGQRDLCDDETRLAAILRALLWGLDYAHERGVVHRDIKSENVLFDNVDRPLLTDFGIAMHRADRNRVTDGGFALGSATHMAPEQARGEKVDGRADLYSIGVVAYEKLAGELPFQAEGPLQMAVRHAVDPIPRLPASKAHWQEFIDRALAKSPDARFESAQAMMTALDQIEQGRQPPVPPSAAIASASAGATPAKTISPAFVTIAACIVLLLALVVATQAWRQGDTASIAGAQMPSIGAPPAANAIETTTADTVVAVAATPDAALATEDAAQQQAVPGEVEDSLVAESMPDATPDAAEAAALAEEAALPPGPRALRAAARQIHRQRLTQPAGDNALESLRTAWQTVPSAPQLPRLGEAWLKAAQPHVSAAFAPTVEQPDLRLYTAARELSVQLQLGQGDALNELQRPVVAWLRGRLRAALTAQDVRQLRAAKAQADSLGIAAGRLEPEWSQGIVAARAGQPLAGAPSQTLLRLPEGDRPGVAVLAGPVSRGDYARFVAATGRSEATCRIRSATFNMRKRRWNAPGFEQVDSQPVVCVSLADAQAYAQWSSQQQGRAWRLPSAAEWHAMKDVVRAADACAERPADCTQHGQVREWAAPCQDRCIRQPVMGFGWREAEQAGRTREPAVDPAHGYDDVGFRLVREVARAELEQR